jgi:hypothetical protein
MENTFGTPRPTVAAADIPLGSRVLPVFPVDRSRYQVQRFVRRVRSVLLALFAIVVIPFALAPDIAFDVAWHVPGGANAVGSLLAVVLLLAVLAGACTWVLRQGGRRASDRQLQQTCAARGWRFADADGVLRTRFPHLPFLRQHGVTPVGLRCVAANSGPWTWWMLEERGPVPTSWEELAAQGAHRAYLTTWVVQLPGADLRRWSVLGRDATRPQEWLRDGMAFELESFNRAFTVRHDRGDEAYAHAMTHPRLIDLVDGALPDGGQLIAAGDALCLQVEGPLHVHDLERNAGLLLTAADLLPRHLLRAADA